MERFGFKAVPFTEVEISDPSWRNRLEIHQKVTVDTCIAKCEETRIPNFTKAAKKEGNFIGRFYDDSDVYKVLEGAAYSLMHVRNEELEKKVDAIIEEIASAQEENGYLMSYFSLEEPEEKWTDLDKHEMYCGGHLVEAAVAYYASTGKRRFLDVAIGLVDHYMTMFGPDKRVWVPGHEEIELALVKLYKTTNEEKYLHFSKWLTDNRGNGYGVDGDEAGFLHPKFGLDNSYFQHDAPVTDIEKVKGHAVRAMYLYIGMADIAKHLDNTNYIEALHRVWDNLVNKNMYITGAIGSSKENEGFTVDYDLPNASAYGETCAGIGFFLWNWRMAQLEGDSKYIDVMERTLYNNILAGWSLSGDAFFYVNPLEADGTHHRKPWYTTACCPTNICRFIPSIGDYIYGVNDDALYVHLYMASQGSISYKGEKVNVRQETTYPAQGTVTVIPETDRDMTIRLRLRKPDWCDSFTLLINNRIGSYSYVNGYIDLVCHSGDKVALHMDMPVRKWHAHEKVKVNAGKVAISRGPIVYALEACDQDKDLNDIEINDSQVFSVDNPLLDYIPSLKCFEEDGNLAATFIPYYQWNNRGNHGMKVWVSENKVKELYH